MLVNEPFILFDNNILYRLHEIPFNKFANKDNIFFAVKEELIQSYNGEIETQYTIFNTYYESLEYMNEYDTDHDKYYSLRLTILLVSYDKDYLINTLSIVRSKTV